MGWNELAFIAMLKCCVGLRVVVVSHKLDVHAALLGLFHAMLHGSSSPPLVMPTRIGFGVVTACERSGGDAPNSIFNGSNSYNYNAICARNESANKKEKPLSIDRGVRTLFRAAFTRARTPSDRRWAQTKGDTAGRRRGSLIPTLASDQTACQSSEQALIPRFR